MGDQPGSAASAVGTIIAERYELIAPLGTGGMAQVWTAEDRLLSRRVAVKILHPHLAHDPSFVQRFRREAVAAARLVHPNIVAVYDTVSAGDVEAIVMELVEGTTLREAMDRDGPLPEAQVRAIGRDLAGALDCAHRNGLVHRDIKPANILITADGTARLTDFGIAKAEEDPDLTVAGTLVGTAAYLAPEQVGGGRIDQRTDLYSLSTVLYEAASGAVPFRGDSPAATALARLHQDPAPLDSTGVRLSDRFRRAVMRNLERAPERRFQSALDFGAALADSARGRSAADDSPTGEVTSPSADGATSTIALQGRSTASVPTTVATTPAAQPATGRRKKPVRRERRSILGRVLLAILLVGPVALIAVLLTDSGDDPSSDGSSPETTIESVPIATAAAFDPLGDDGVENDAQTGAVIDDDAATGWSTSSYRARDFGIKDGVGLTLGLGDERSPVELTLTGSTGWKGRVWVLEEDPATSAGPPAAGGVAVSADSSPTTLRLRGTGSYVLIWITDLGPAQADGQHRVTITGASLTARVAAGG